MERIAESSDMIIHSMSFSIDRNGFRVDGFSKVSDFVSQQTS